MKWIVLAISLLFASPASAAGYWAPFQAYQVVASGGVTGGILKTGAAGYVVGIDAECDTTCGNGSGTSTMMVRLDTYGGDWFNPASNCGNATANPFKTGCWQPIVSIASMTNSADQQYYPEANKQSLELRIAPSNTNDAVMIWAPYGTGQSPYYTKLYTTTNKGGTWTSCSAYSGWTGVIYAFAYRTWGPSIAIDPSNPSIYYVGSPNTGFQATTNGCANMGAVTNLGNGSLSAGMGVIAFDPSSTSGGHTNTAYACVQETGVYKTTDAEDGPTSNWTELNSANMPPDCQKLKVDNSGNVWVVDCNTPSYPYCVHGRLWKYNGSSWANVGPSDEGNGTTFAFDPYNNNFMVYAGGCAQGKIWISLDGGTTWTHQAAATHVAYDIPWLATTNETCFPPGDVVFDPALSQWTTSTNVSSFSGNQTITVANSTFGNLPNGTVVTVYNLTDGVYAQGTLVHSGSSGSTVEVNFTASSGSPTSGHTFQVGTNMFFMSEGIGVWYMSPPIFASQAVNIYSQSAAIEQLVSTDMANPTGSAACGALGTSASVNVRTVEDRQFIPIVNSSVYPSVQAPNTGIFNGWSAGWSGLNPQTIVGVTQSATPFYISTDCGNSFTNTSSTPTGWDPSGTAGNKGIAVAASTTADMVITENAYGSFYTSNSGAAWSPITAWGNCGGNTCVPVEGDVVATSGSVTTITMSGGVPTWVSSDISAGFQLQFYDLTANCYTNGYATTPVTGTTFTLSSALTNGSTACTVTSGDHSVLRGSNGYNGISALRADLVTDNTFYVIVGTGSTTAPFTNTAGTYRSTDGGATWTQQCSYNSSGSACPFVGNEALLQLQTVPGHAGHLWASMGPDFSATHPNSSQLLIWSNNGGTSWNTIANVEEPICVGVGAAVVGSYPAIYFQGWYNSGSGYNPGFYRIDNADGSGSGIAFKQLNASDTNPEFPNGSLDTINVCQGDGRLAKGYVGFAGSGWLQYQQNFLLNRDLDPASNDNSPVGLAKVG